MNPNKPTTEIKIEETVQVAQEPVASPTVTVQTTTKQSAPVAKVAVEETAPVAAVVPKTALEELKSRLDTLPSAVKSYLRLIDDAAKQMSNGPQGILLDTSGIHRKQSVIFGSIMKLITDTPDDAFNLTMYALALVFKENGESRVGGLSPERAFQAIDASASEKSPGVTNYQWIVGKTEEDIGWYRSVIVAMHTAHSRGNKALKATANVVDTVCKHRALMLDKTVSNRLRTWFDNCNPL